MFRSASRKLTGYFYNEDATAIWAEVTEVATRYTTAFVTGEMDIETQWQEFQDAMNAAGLQEYKALLKEYVDAQGIELGSVLS